MADLETYDLELHQAALILGDPIAEAYEWLRAYAANLTDQCSDDEYYSGSNSEITVVELLETADSHQGGSDNWGDYITRGGAFEGQSVDSTFWKYYAIFKEIPREEVNEQSFFSCSC